MDDSSTPWLLVALPFVVLNVLYAVLAACAWTGRLRKNRLLGIRTPSTLSSAETWTRAHRVAAPWWAAGAALGIACAVTAAVAGWTLDATTPTQILLGLSFLCPFVMLIAGSIAGTRVARSLR